MFGLVDLDSITLIEDHDFTEFAGRVMFGAYSYITVIVLLNMLIAMMNNSYQIISVRLPHNVLKKQQFRKVIHFQQIKRTFVLG